MAVKKPIVIGTNGEFQQLQTGDTITAINKGQSTIVFMNFDVESNVTITGQTGINSTSGITAVILSDSDDVLVQDWSALLISNIINDVGFTITAKPSIGRWKGNLIIKWSWV